MRHQRQALSEHQQNLAAGNLARRLWRLQCVRRARTVAAYWPADGEISPLAFLRQALRWRKRIYLPAISRHHNKLHFFEWHPGRTLRRNPFGISEPASSAAPLDLKSLDVLLMPLVAFDAHGHRLGMGGGFYDRTLARLGQKRPRLIGVAHDIQQVEWIETAPWDIDLDLVVSDRRVYAPRKRRIC